MGRKFSKETKSRAPTKSTSIRRSTSQSNSILFHKNTKFNSTDRQFFLLKDFRKTLVTKEPREKTLAEKEITEEEKEIKEFKRNRIRQFNI